MKCRLAPVLLGLCLLAISLPALAKIPPFAIVVEPETPIVGEPVTVTVELTQSVQVEELEGLIAFFPAEDAESRVQGTPVPLNRVEETTYQAVVVLPEPGEWRIVSFPDRTGWPTDEVPDGYPDQIPIQVAAGGQAETSALVVGFGLLLGAAALIGWKAMGSETKPF
jgi:hypothetical protein